jgi:hypothetical protein
MVNSGKLGVKIPELSLTIFSQKKCALCPYVFATSELEAKHLIEVHNILAPHRCRIPNHNCNKCYSVPASLLTHEYISRLDPESEKTGKWLFKCTEEECNFKPNLSSRLDLHRKRLHAALETLHYNVYHATSFCGASPSSLKEHGASASC